MNTSKIKTGLSKTLEWDIYFKNKRLLSGNYVPGIVLSLVFYIIIFNPHHMPMMKIAFSERKTCKSSNDAKL